MAAPDDRTADLSCRNEPSAPARKPGRLKGRIRMAEDFDTLPPEILAAMEGAEDIGGDEEGPCVAAPLSEA